MKVLAQKMLLGNRICYLASMTFGQVAEHVKRVDEVIEISSSTPLKKLIQRSLTSNVNSIKEYITENNDVFFNALVLAVFNEVPDWEEFVLRDETFEYFNIGILNFPRHHKVFAVDGQHRVEGIKEALKKKPELHNQNIAAIIIEHRDTEQGIKRTRRLFSALNRYAKPVSLDDSIALDENDISAMPLEGYLKNIHSSKANR